MKYWFKYIHLAKINWLLKDFLLLCIQKKKEVDLTNLRYLHLLDVHFAQIWAKLQTLDFVINQFQRGKVNFSSWKQNWFPAPYTATSRMTAQLLSVNGCRNTGVDISHCAAHYTRHTVRTLYTTHNLLQTTHWQLHTAHYTVHTIHCTLYTAH